MKHDILLIIKIDKQTKKQIKQSTLVIRNKDYNIIVAFKGLFIKWPSMGWSGGPGYFLELCK